jgi:hypothetical protein
MTEAQSGMRLADAGKQYSKASSAALEKLHLLDKKFEGITGRIENVSALQNQEDLHSHLNVLQLIKAKNELAQIAGDLERLQCRELDAIETAELHSGKQEARSQRKTLNTAVENLMHRTQDLHKEFVTTIEKLQANSLPIESDAGNSTVLEADEMHSVQPIPEQSAQESTETNGVKPINESALGAESVSPKTSSEDPACVLSSPAAAVGLDTVDNHVPIRQSNKSAKQRPPAQHPYFRRRPVHEEYYQPHPFYSLDDYYMETPRHRNAYRTVPSRRRPVAFHPGFFF